MPLRFHIGSIVTIVLWSTAGAGVPEMQAAEPDTRIGPPGVIYSRSSTEVWVALGNVLHELQLRTRKSAPESGVLVTARRLSTRLVSAPRVRPADDPPGPAVRRLGRTRQARRADGELLQRWRARAVAGRARREATWRSRRVDPRRRGGSSGNGAAPAPGSPERPVHDARARDIGPQRAVA